MAVEFALVLPILMLILVGIMEYSLVLSAQINVTNAAREGARSMALHKSVATAKADTMSAAFGLSPALTASQIAVTPTTCAVGALSTTTVSYDYQLLTGLFGDTITITGKAAMRCGG